MNDTVSIIIPIYNVKPYLKKCIESVRNQTYQNLQIILVDDGSTDGSSDLCDWYQEQDERIVVIHKSNGGLVSARKTGLRAAEGDYVLNVDSDDWIEADMVARLYKVANENSADIVCSAHFLDIGNLTKKITNRLETGNYATEQLRTQLLYNGIFFQFNITAFIWSKLFKREILEKAQYTVDEEISFGEDIAVTFPGILFAKNISVTDYAGYHYVQRSGSITNINYPDELKRDIALIRYLNRIFSKQCDAEILRGQLNQYAKLLLLLRQPAWFDQKSNTQLLMPFGGIPSKCSVVIYTAGKLGQSVFQYLSEIDTIHIVDWLDQNFDMYQKLGFPVHDPKEFPFAEKTYDYIIVAMSEQPISMAISRYLLEQGAPQDSIRCLTDSFMSDDHDILKKTCISVAICGYRKYGRALYAQLQQQGIQVAYIIERNYQALAAVEQLPVPIVGFDADLYDQADVIILTPDLDEAVVRECMELAGIRIPLISYDEFQAEME